MTAVTLSPAQRDFARRRVFEQGLSDKVDIQLIDYRDVQGRFDRIVSIEMFEAVGEAYWPAYFAKVRELLRPGGRAGLQVITIDEALFDTYRRRPDFIQMHIFPGGMLPSEQRLRPVVEEAGLSWSVERRFGRDYARTLAEWDTAFVAAWSHVRECGFDENFKRLWRYYLNYCRAGFALGRIDVVHLVTQSD